MAASWLVDMVAKDRNGILTHLPLSAPTGPLERRGSEEPADNCPTTRGYAVHAGSETTSPDATPTDRVELGTDAPSTHSGYCVGVTSEIALTEPHEPAEVTRGTGPHDSGSARGVLYDTA